MLNRRARRPTWRRRSPQPRPCRGRPPARRRSDILGSSWDDESTSPSLEQLDDPAATGVPVLAKRLVVDLGTVAGVPGEIQGIARVDRDTLALINDNDFGMTDGAEAFDAQGRLVDSGVETSVVYVRLPRGIRQT